MKESEFQKKLIKELKSKFPGSIILKTDPSYIQGCPDLLMLYGKHWAALECKRDKNSKKRPNQEYYISKMNKMSYASFVYPQNKKGVLNDLERTFKPRRNSCIS